MATDEPELTEEEERELERLKFEIIRKHTLANMQVYKRHPLLAWLALNG